MAIAGGKNKTLDRKPKVLLPSGPINQKALTPTGVD